MQQRRVAKLLQPLRAECQIAQRSALDAVDHLGLSNSEIGNTLGMALGGNVAHFDRFNRRLNETLEQALDRLDKPAFFKRYAGLRCKGYRNAFVTLVELHDQFFGLRGRVEHRLERRLAVDKSNDADDLVTKVAHRHAQDGFGPVTRALVKAQSKP